MSVYKPKGGTYYKYDFKVDGGRFAGSTRETEKRAAEAFERDRRAEAFERDRRAEAKHLD